MCNCNQGGGCGCALMNGIADAISNLFSTAPYCGGCNGGNGCGCNNNNNNNGCGCMAFDPYYMQQYGLYPFNGGSGCSCGCGG